VSQRGEALHVLESRAGIGHTRAAVLLEQLKAALITVGRKSKSSDGALHAAAFGALEAGKEPKTRRAPPNSSRRRPFLWASVVSLGYSKTVPSGQRTVISFSSMKLIRVYHCNAPNIARARQVSTAWTRLYVCLAQEGPSCGLTDEKHESRSGQALTLFFVAPNRHLRYPASK
jgi:hypothetical protein